MTGTSRNFPESCATDPWRENIRIVGRDEATDAIAQAKEAEGGSLLVLGGMTTWNGLLAAGLVDELDMMVGAGVLIDGVPAFLVRPPRPDAADRGTAARRPQHHRAALLAGVTATHLVSAQRWGKTWSVGESLATNVHRSTDPER